MASSSVSTQIEPAPDRLRGSRFHLGKTVAVVVLVGVTSLCWVFRRPWFQANLGVVDPGQVMRSAQPRGQLASWVRDFQISSILNLRGGSPADSWYDAEVRLARESGVSFYDLPLSATRRPTRRKLLVLIDLLGRCPYPLLIHCKSGADRTGLVSALYLMVRRGMPPESAAPCLFHRIRPHTAVRDRAPSRAAQRVRRLAQDQSTAAFTRAVSRLGQEQLSRDRPSGGPPCPAARAACSVSVSEE